MTACDYCACLACLWPHMSLRQRSVAGEGFHGQLGNAAYGDCAKPTKCSGKDGQNFLVHHPSHLHHQLVCFLTWVAGVSHTW